MLVIFYTVKQSTRFFKLVVLLRLLQVAMHVKKTMNGTQKLVLSFASPKL